MKFRTDVTKGGHKILFLSEPDPAGWRAGAIQDRGKYVRAVEWDFRGLAKLKEDLVPEFDLIPIEPKVEYGYLEVVPAMQKADSYEGPEVLVNLRPCRPYNLKLTFHDGVLVDARVIGEGKQ